MNIANGPLIESVVPCLNNLKLRVCFYILSLTWVYSNAFKSNKIFSLYFRQISVSIVNSGTKNVTIDGIDSSTTMGAKI